MDKPRWFLDVDGPLNATNPGTWVWQSTYAEATVRGYVIRYSPSLINHIRDIAKGGKIDPVWCTTWVPHAKELEEALKLPPLACAFEECTPYTAWTEKLRAVEKFNQISDQPWVWTDDEAPSFGPVYESLTESGRGLIIRANPHTGITPAELAQIKVHLGLTHDFGVSLKDGV